MSATACTSAVRSGSKGFRSVRRRETVREELDRAREGAAGTEEEQAGRKGVQGSHHWPVGGFHEYGPDRADRAALRVRGVFHGFQVRAGQLLSGRTREAGRPGRPADRVLPERLFSDDDEKKKPDEAKKETKEDKRERQIENDIERKMNKTALVTLWVDPSNHQIVKYTFDNVWLDFLPGAWLVKVDAMKASMTMSQPFAGVWLPRDIKISAGVTLANGSFEADYDRGFAEYREADVKSKIRIPKGPDPKPTSVPRERGSDPNFEPSEGTSRGSGPFDPQDLGEEPSTDHKSESGPDPVSCTEIVREVRVHGNAQLADVEILKIAGITVDGALPPDGIEAIERRLKSSGRFETVDVRKRYRSIDDPTRRRRHPRRPRKSHGRRQSNHRRTDDQILAVALLPPDVPADPLLRGRLRLHLRRAGQHQGPARSRRATVGPAHMGRHPPDRARSGTDLQTRPAHPLLVERCTLPAGEPALTR